MRFPNPDRRRRHFTTTWMLVSLWVCCLPSPTRSESRASEAGVFCGTSNFAPGSSLDPRLVGVMTSLSTQITLQQWGTAGSTGIQPQISAFAQCHHDLSLVDCQLCFAKCRAKLPRCLPATSARIYLEGCYLRYDNYTFLLEVLEPRSDVVQCEETATTFADKYMSDKFANRVHKVLQNVTDEAAASAGGFAAAEAVGEASAYALAQCWTTVQGPLCRQCLDSASSKLRNCVPRTGGRAMYAGCYLRYSAGKFFDSNILLRDRVVDDVGVTPSKGVMAVSILAFLLVIVMFGACLGHAKFGEAKKEWHNLVRLSSNLIESHLRFEYDVLDKATNCFDPSRKLGQGGAGSVYRGVLPDGKIVAVKRLCYNTTRHWADEFFNEVNLLSGIQHKNLVRLLGCSVNGPDSLLVYEYVPNKALDRFVFGKNKAQILSWKQRFHIILGISEGLAYLHGGSDAKIIHRDIKCSNILLDENLTPKIADFGLVRCHAPDKPHVTTDIAGTLGYMAPEYLVQGHLTEKADVYSFGVLILEIVSGKKNSIYTQGDGSMLQTVWKHYLSHNLAQSVDPCLDGKFPVSQASKVLRIGLLCTQASRELRPSMCEIVQMLVNEDSWTPSPQQPPFLNASMLCTDDTTYSE